MIGPRLLVGETPSPLGRTSPTHEMPKQARAVIPSRLSKHAPLLAAVPVLVAFYWLVTYGTWRPFDREDFGQFYDAQAGSLLAGRWDVPWEGIGEEAFVRDGKFYGYFGFAPALPRMALNAFFPSLEGRWSKLSLTAGCAVTLVLVHLILLQVGPFFTGAPVGPAGPAVVQQDAAGTAGPTRGIFRGQSLLAAFSHAGFILLAGLGSTLIFMGSRSFIFHEAILWGSALSLGCYSCLLRWQRDRKIAVLAAACALAFFAFFTRASVGSGPVAALGFIVFADFFGWWKPTPSEVSRRNPAVFLLPLATVALVASTFVAINYLKFRTCFEAVPLRMYYLMLQDPRRLKRTEGKHMSLANVRTGAAAYLSPKNLKVTRRFPWIYAATETQVQPEARLDAVEPFASLPASSPALFILAAVGLLALPKVRDPEGARPTAIILAAGLGGGTVLAADALSHRYLHDFFPLIVLLGALGLHSLVACARDRSGRLILSLLAPVAAYSLYAGCAIAFVYQREIVAAVPVERTAQLQNWSAAVDRATGLMSAD